MSTRQTIERRSERMCGRFGHLSPNKWQRGTGWKAWTRARQYPCYLCRRCGEIVELATRAPVAPSIEGV